MLENTSYNTLFNPSRKTTFDQPHLVPVVKDPVPGINLVAPGGPALVLVPSYSGLEPVSHVYFQQE